MHCAPAEPAALALPLHPLLCPEIASGILGLLPFAEQVSLRFVCRAWAAVAPASAFELPIHRKPKLYWTDTPEEMFAPWLDLMAQLSRLHAAGEHLRAAALLRDATADVARALERGGPTLLQASASRNRRPSQPNEEKAIFDRWCRFLHGALTALAASAPPAFVLAGLAAARDFYPERMWAGPAAEVAARHGNAPAALALLVADGSAGTPKLCAAAAAAACRTDRVETLRTLLKVAPPPPSHCHDLVWGAAKHHAWGALAEVRHHYWRLRSPSAELSLEWSFAEAARWGDEAAALRIYRLSGFRPGRRVRLLALRHACHQGLLALARRLMADGLSPADLYDDSVSWDLPVHCPEAWRYYGDTPRAIQPFPLHSPAGSPSRGCAWELALETAGGANVAAWLAASYGPPDGARIRALRDRRRAANLKHVMRYPDGAPLTRKDRHRVARGKCLYWLTRNGENCLCPCCN